MKKEIIYNTYPINRKKSDDIIINKKYCLRAEYGYKYLDFAIIKDTSDFKLVALYNGMLCGPRFKTIKAAIEYIDNNDLCKKIDNAKKYKVDKTIQDIIDKIAMLYN